MLTHTQQAGFLEAPALIGMLVGTRQTWCSDRTQQHTFPAHQPHGEPSHTLRVDAIGTMAIWCAGWATGP
jgi:hypothetical protein